jgi:hypothetical protein
MHWFYFRVITQGLEKGTRVKLNIKNLYRTISLFEKGMLPRLYYVKQTGLETGKQGWHVDPRATYGCSFFKTNQADPDYDPS